MQMQAWMGKRTPRAWEGNWTSIWSGESIGPTNSPRHGVTGQVLGLAFLQSCSSLVRLLAAVQLSRPPARAERYRCGRCVTTARSGAVTFAVFVFVLVAGRYIHGDAKREREAGNTRRGFAGGRRNSYYSVQ